MMAVEAPLSAPMRAYTPPSPTIEPGLVPLLRAIHDAAIRQVPPTLTVEDARRSLSAIGGEPPANPNAWGDAFSLLSVEGAIKRVGQERSYRREARGRTVTVWVVVNFRLIRRLLGDQREEGEEEAAPYRGPERRGPLDAFAGGTAP